MKISDLIKDLQQIKKENGDLDVFTTRFNGSASLHPGLRVQHIRKRVGREALDRWFSDSFDEPELKGEKVLRL